MVTPTGRYPRDIVVLVLIDYMQSALKTEK